MTCYNVGKTCLHWLQNIIIVFFIMYMFIFCAMYVYELIEMLWSSIYHGKWLEWIKILNLEFVKWRHLPNYQICCLCKRNFDAIVVLMVMPSGANFRSLWSASLGFTSKISRIHTESMFICKQISIKFPKFREFCNISVRPGDHAQFLETRRNSVRLGRSGSAT